MSSLACMQYYNRTKKINAAQRDLNISINLTHKFYTETYGLNSLLQKSQFQHKKQTKNMIITIQISWQTRLIATWGKTLCVLYKNNIILPSSLHRERASFSYTYIEIIRRDLSDPYTAKVPRTCINWWLIHNIIIISYNTYASLVFSISSRALRKRSARFS